MRRNLCRFVGAFVDCGVDDIKKGIRVIGCFVLFSVLFLLTVSATTYPSRVYDEAQLLSAEEVEGLEGEIRAVKESTGLDFAVVTTDDAGGMTAREYANHFYDSNAIGAGQSKNGALFLIDMDNREAYIVTNGFATNCLNSRVQDILDEVFEYLPDGKYYESAIAFLETSEYYINTNSNHYDPVSDTVTEHHFYQTWEIVLAILLPLVVAGAVFGIVCGLYSRTGKTVPYPFRQQSKLDLTQAEDQFINTTVTTRRIESSSGGGRAGGGSGGGGGRGGGGRSF